MEEVYVIPQKDLDQLIQYYNGELTENALLNKAAFLYNCLRFALCCSRWFARYCLCLALICSRWVSRYRFLASAILARFSSRYRLLLAATFSWYLVRYLAFCVAFQARRLSRLCINRSSSMVWGWWWSWWWREASLELIAPIVAAVIEPFDTPVAGQLRVMARRPLFLDLGLSFRLGRPFLSISFLQLLCKLRHTLVLDTVLFTFFKISSTSKSHSKDSNSSNNFSCSGFMMG